MKMKMKIKASKEMLGIVFIAVTMAVLVMITMITVHVVAHKDDISVSAEVKEVCVELPPGVADETGGASKYAVVSYNINGENFEGKYSLPPFHGVSQGDIIEIKVNPEDYSDIKNDFSFSVMIFFGVFFFLFDVFLFFAIKKVLYHENRLSRGNSSTC